MASRRRADALGSAGVLFGALLVCAAVVPLLLGEVAVAEGLGLGGAVVQVLALGLRLAVALRPRRHPSTTAIRPASAPARTG
ncbi:hypothetical protein BH18ACT1_BH18ACT1_12960 [soil metagenome]